MPRLTEYLLKLATDARALDEYRKHRDGKEAMDLQTFLTRESSPGLTREQADALESRKPKRIQDAMLAELRAESSDPVHQSNGIPLTIHCEVNRIEAQHAPQPPQDS